MRNFSITEGALPESVKIHFADDTTSETPSDTDNSTETGDSNTSEGNSTESKPTETNKDNPDTGVAGVAAAFGVITLAAGAVLVSKKR